MVIFLSIMSPRMIPGKVVAKIISRGFLPGDLDFNYGVQLLGENGDENKGKTFRNVEPIVL